jgi:hypothetical protein
MVGAKMTLGKGSAIPRMRGGAFHNFLVAQSAEQFQEAGFEVLIEYPLQLLDGRRDYIDLLARREGAMIACEVETTARHVLDNLAKARTLGLTLWFVVPTRKVRAAVARKVQRASKTPSDAPIQILLIGEVFQRLTSCLPSFSAANTPPENGKTISERETP